MKYTTCKLPLALTAGTLAIVATALLVAGQWETAAAVSLLANSLVLCL